MAATLVTALIGCGGGVNTSNGNKFIVGDKDIINFTFRASDNPILADDVPGIITGDEIQLVLPYGSSSLTLAAYFETTGVSVTVDGAEQDSGSTINDYSVPVVFRVTAEDMSVRDYTVTVSVGKNDAKELVSFTLDGERGMIDTVAGTVTVTFSANKNLDSLVASFAATGVSVTVGGTAQESGVTTNDYHQPVAFSVWADNGTVREYLVTAVRNSEIPGMWNFDSIDGEGYTVSGAQVVPALDGNGLDFDGVEDYVLVPDDDSLGLGESGSLEVIFKLHSYRDFAGVVHKGVNNDFSDEAYSLQFWTGNVLRIMITGETGQSIFTDTGGQLDLDTWYHVVATWDSSELRLYVNGSLVSSQPNTIGLVRDSSGGLVIGAQLADQHYNSTYRNLCLDGTIDRVVVYTRALGAEEIYDLYAN